jgi:anti-sigma B factor antagonist
MKITTEKVGSVMVITVIGKILIGEGDDALREMVIAAADKGHTKMVLDLAQVPYIDAAGLGEIVRSHTLLSRKGGRLVLCNLTRSITDLLTITKLLTAFPTFESREGAVKALLQM